VAAAEDLARERDLEVAVDEADFMPGERLRRRCAEHLARAAVEGGAVQGADHPHAAQSPLVEAREGVAADVVERVEALARVADQDLARADELAPHLAFGDPVRRT